MRRAAGGPDRRHAVRRRRGPSRSARVARLVGERSGEDALSTRCARSCCRCPTRRWSIPRTAPARCAARQLSKETVSTIGEQRRTNYALQPMSEPEFIELVTADQPDAPSYFTYDAVLNTKERPTLDADARASAQAARRSTCCCRCRRSARRCSTCATRSSTPRAHLKGSLNIGLGGQLRHVGRHDPRSRQADRHRRRARTRGRGGHAARPHRLRQRRRLSARRHQRARIAHRSDDRHDAGDAGRSRRRACLANAADCPRHPRAEASGRSRTSRAA